MDRVNGGLQQAMDECKRELRAFRRDLTKLEERCCKGDESKDALFRAQRELEERLGPLEMSLANLESQIDYHNETGKLFRSYVNRKIGDIYRRLTQLIDITGI